MAYNPDEVVVITGYEVVRQGERAVRLYFEDLDDEIWLPFSQILAGDPEYDDTLEIPMWLAREKGLV